MQKKYLIAIIPPEQILQKIEGIKHDLFLKHSLKGALRSPAHITLHRPFEWKIEKENGLIESLKNFKSKSIFEIELVNYNCFEPRVIYIDVLKNQMLNQLHDELMKYATLQLKLFNETEDMRGFQPHITIAFRDLKKQKFNEVWEEFRLKVFKEKFLYEGFCLLRFEKKWEIIEVFNI